MKRFHLSTLLLLTVLAGAFIGAQFWERESYFCLPRNIHLAVLISSDFDPYCVVRGWPLPYTGELRRREYLPRDWFHMSALTANCLIGLASLALAGYVSEKIIRRKKSV